MYVYIIIIYNSSPILINLNTFYLNKNIFILLILVLIISALY